MNKRDFIKGAGLMSTLGAVSAFGVGNAEKVGAAIDRISAGKSILNVLDFGAKGDGKTNDTAAIQSAMDAAAKVEGVVYFPSGRYVCGGLKMSPYTTLMGDAQWIFKNEQRGAVLILDSEERDCLVDITGAFGARIKGLTLQGIRTAKKEIHGIFLNNPKFSKKEDTVVFDDIKVQQFTGHGLYLLRAWLFIIRHSQFMANNGCGVMLVGWDGFVTDNQFTANGSHGFGCSGIGSTVMFTANRVEWNKGCGLYLPKGNTWNVVGNSFDRNHGAGLKTGEITATTVTGNVFRRCGKDPSSMKGDEISANVIFDGSRGLSFVGNAFRAGQDDRGKGKFTPEYGFYLRNLDYSVITNNVLHLGYMKDIAQDMGGHGKSFVFENNVGCPMTVFK